MILNGEKLYRVNPLSPMLRSKERAHGLSHGMSEAGYDVRIKDGVVLHPFRRFVLASTFERFVMPQNLVGVVHDKSTWARRGLSVLNTVIEPGWHGWLTLELVYHGLSVLRVPKGAGIAQVVFHETRCSASYDGKYQGQANMPVKAILDGQS